MIIEPSNILEQTEQNISKANTGNVVLPSLI